ncbi:MAG TPA: hypothetical protein VK762_07050 [Polyangiaceae bacterium]|jgi:hypothetical protein|nr:hypothetical protein [Polyangiaceae bacterium]
MLGRVQATSLGVGLLALTAGCGNETLPPQAPSACEIVPKEHENEENYRRAAGDLHAKILASIDVGTSLTAEQKQAVDATFQKVPDRFQACAMLTKTYDCLGMAKHDGLALALLNTVNATCAPGASPDAASPAGTPSTGVVINGDNNHTAVGSDNHVR